MHSVYSCSYLKSGNSTESLAVFKRSSIWTSTDWQMQAFPQTVLTRMKHFPKNTSLQKSRPHSHSGPANLLRYTSDCSTSLFIHEPPMLVLPLTKQNLSHSSHFLRLHSPLPVYDAPSFLPRGGPVECVCACVFCGTGAFTRVPLVADVPACQPGLKK